MSRKGNRRPAAQGRDGVEVTRGFAEKRVLYGRVSDNDAYREKHVFGINGWENARWHGKF